MDYEKNIKKHFNTKISKSWKKCQGNRTSLKLSSFKAGVNPSTFEKCFEHSVNQQLKSL